MVASVTLQAGVEIPGGGLLAIIVTFLVAWLFYAVSLHLAATFFVGEVPTQPAAAATLAPAAMAVLFIQFTPAVVIGMTLLADAVGIWYAYELTAPATVALALLHFAFATVLVLALNNIFGFV